MAYYVKNTCWNFIQFLYSTIYYIILNPFTLVIKVNQIYLYFPAILLKI